MLLQETPAATQAVVVPVEKKTPIVDLLDKQTSTPTPVPTILVPVTPVVTPAVIPEVTPAVTAPAVPVSGQL